MNVQVITPTQVVLDAEAVHVTVEDVTGSLGFRPGHLPLATALAVGLLVARDENGAETYVAIDGGVLVVSDDTVTVTSRRAVTGDDIDRLESTVLEDFRDDAERERSANSTFQRLRVAFLKRLLDLDVAGTLT